MGADSKIQWTTHTFNPWRGCTKVSDGCKFCYADALSKRNPKTLGVWGPNGARVVAAESAWKEPVKWNRLAHEAGERHRVFCASLADVFEGEDTMPAEAWPVVQEARKRLFDLICRTPDLDWLLLTKRPQHALRLMVDAKLYATANPSLPCPQPNIWIGTSVENQAAADERIPHLLRCPAAVRFLSCEPLLGPVDLSRWLNVAHGFLADFYLNGNPNPSSLRPDWIIVGGESGPGARPFHVEWARDIIGQCKAAGVAAFCKQLGANVIDTNTTSADHFEDEQCWPGGTKTDYHRVLLKDKKGGAMEEWPTDLRVRSFPAERREAAKP